MNTEDSALLRSLLADRQVLSLGVLVDGEPYVGMLPFAVAQNMGALVIHASRLARHSKGLSDGASIGILIHESEAFDLDPLQLPRVSLQATVRILRPETAEYEECKQQYIEKFPQSERTFSLGDFQLYALELKSGRLVAGFARTVNLNADHFRELRNQQS